MKALSPNEIFALDPRAIDSESSSLPCPVFSAEAMDFALPERAADSHKYNYGRALIIAGCRGFGGAPCLAANACERSGAGLTVLLVLDAIYEIAAVKVDGAVAFPLPASRDGRFSIRGLETIMAELEKASVCLIGPGLGQSEDLDSIVAAVVENARCPVIIDADGINALSRHIDLLDKAKARIILTPHEGEFARIACKAENDRLNLAHSFAARYDCTVILKGHRTVVASGQDAYINTTGGPAMAKGGSGDVLAGILAALLAQGFDTDFSAKAAVYLHGLAGDIACGKVGEYCLAPSDIISALPEAFATLTTK